MITASIQITKEHTLDADTIRDLILPSEPWKTLGFNESDIPGMITTSQNDELLVVRQDKKIIGAALYQFNTIVGGYMRLLVVAPAQRGQGLGRKIIQAVEQDIFSKHPNFYLCVSDFNVSAQAFYESCGFQKTGLLTGLLVPGKDEILMRKTIGSLREFRQRQISEKNSQS